MVDLSNKVLSILVIIAIIISLVSIFLAPRRELISLTGYTIATEKVNLTIETVVSISVENDVEFGQGSVDADSAYADLWGHNGTIEGGDWSFGAQTIKIENQGNANMEINVKTDKLASEMMGGDDPLFEYFIQEGENGSCLGGILNGSSYQSWSDADNYEKVCSALLPNQDSDLLVLGIHLRVPDNAESGIKEATITIEGSLT